MPTRLAFYTPAQAAKIKGCSLSALYRAMKEGRLRAVTIGPRQRNQRWLISPKELACYEPLPFTWRNHRRAVRWRKQPWESQDEFEARKARGRHG